MTQIESKTEIDRPSVAKTMLTQYIDIEQLKTGDVKHYVVRMVWYNYTLGGWKALFCTDLPDGMYYEITYNNDKNETYIDAYKKIDNVCIPG